MTEIRDKNNEQESKKDKKEVNKMNENKTEMNTKQLDALASTTGSGNRGLDDDQ